MKSGSKSDNVGLPISSSPVIGDDNTYGTMYVEPDRFSGNDNDEDEANPLPPIVVVGEEEDGEVGEGDEEGECGTTPTGAESGSDGSGITDGVGVIGNNDIDEDMDMGMEDSDNRWGWV